MPNASGLISPAQLWQPAVPYPLQPAPHFAGRQKLLKELSDWATATDDPNRVVALVAAGGTGKTALTERIVSRLSRRKPFGVFVLSFYEKLQTEAFLRAAYEYLIGEVPKGKGGPLQPPSTFLPAAS